MKHAVKIVSLAALLVLAACISGRPPQDTYTSETTGKTTLIQTDHEMCESSCNEDDSRCMDTEPAGETLPGEVPGMFGPAKECRSELATCLSGCKSK